MKSVNWNYFLRLLRYALPYKRYAAAQFALMGVSIGVGLLKPWPLKVLVDHVAGDQPFGFGAWDPQWTQETLLVLSCLAYLIFHAGDSLVQMGSVTVATTLSSKMIRDLRSDVLRCLQSLSLKFHDSHRVGDNVHRITFNTTAVETAFQSGFMGVVKSIVMLISMFVIMLSLNPTLTAVALAIVPILLVCIRWYGRRIYQVSRDHQNQEGSVSSRVQEILSSIRLIQAFTQESAEQARFDKLSDRSVATRLRTVVTQNVFSFFVAVVFALGTALLFYVGFRQIQADKLTIGEFLVFNAYVAMIYSPLTVLSYSASSVQSALGGGSRLFEVLDAEPEVKDRPGARDLERVEGRIEVEHLHFGYEPGQHVLNNVNLRVEPREKIAIVGETGGGKSTFLNMLLRFYEPVEGRILIDGIDMRDVRLDSLRRNIALVPQETLLLSDSIRENIAYGRPSAGEKEIVQAARDARAHDFIVKLPQGYDTLVGERGVRLSQGQRQRIALARAFLKNAPVLLLDEPTSALDAETEVRLLERLDELMKGRTVILVAHRLATSRHADRIVVLRDGEMVEMGAHEELLKKNGHYATLWRAQMNDSRAPTKSAS